MPTLIDSYSESNRDVAQGLSTALYSRIGQSFTASGGLLNSVVFFLAKTGSPTGLATATLYAHSGTFGTSSVGTGSALASSDTLDVATLTGSYVLKTFTFSGANQYALVNGTNYMIVLEYAGGDGSNIVNVGTDSSSPTHVGNLARYNGSWGALAQDVCFYVYKVTTAGVPHIHSTHRRHYFHE